MLDKQMIFSPSQLHKNLLANEFASTKNWIHTSSLCMLTCFVCLDEQSAKIVFVKQTGSALASNVGQ